MADTVNCYNEDEICEKCNKGTVEFIHCSDKTNFKLTKVCTDCFREIVM